MKNAPRSLPASGEATGAQALSQRRGEPGKFQLDPPLPLGSSRLLTMPVTTPGILSSHPLTFPAVFAARVELGDVAAVADRVRRVGDKIFAAEAHAETGDPHALTRAQVRQADTGAAGFDELLAASQQNRLWRARRPASGVNTGSSTTRSSRASQFFS